VILQARSYFSGMGDRHVVLQCNDAEIDEGLVTQTVDGPAHRTVRQLLILSTVAQLYSPISSFRLGSSHEHKETKFLIFRLLEDFDHERLPGVPSL
jgi:hypothetical protein